jgi:hypothetical protein
MADPLWYRQILSWLRGEQKAAARSVVNNPVDDSPGWGNLTNRPQDYDSGTIQEIYADVLEAWRKNPIAWRIISITTDYVVGDQLKISSPQRGLNKFIEEFWDHCQNRMALRLPGLCDELSRAGDLFIVLFRNAQDGMSYLRVLTKDRIQRIETAPNDWEIEIAYYEKQDAGEPRKWLSPDHPGAAESDSIMLHYSINRPAGALLGESDLVTMTPWLQRYSRMLEDRVRLHWAVRSFLWIVTVPASAVTAKKEAYRKPPESGSIIVKDSAETWEAVAPDLRATDARWDLQAVRQMVDAGSGYPPHWRGEAGDANLATATAMQGPTERHLLRRQQYFVFMLQDILFHAYQRAREIGRRPAIPTDDYSRLFTAVLPEISRWDNESLARAANQLAAALSAARSILGGESERFKRLSLKLITQFAGEPMDDQELDALMADLRPKATVPTAAPASAPQEPVTPGSGKPE